MTSNMAFSTELKKAQVWLSGHDPVMAVLVSEFGPCKIKPHSNHYAELIDSIISQQLSVKAAATIHDRVLSMYDGKAPTPKQLLEINNEKLRACGVSYAKVAYMKDLALHIVDGRLDLQHINSLPNDELIDQLTAVKGIGEWSAHMYMIFCLGRLDILPVGDLGVQKAAYQLYKLPKQPKKEQLKSLSKKHHWSPYESVASWYLWQSLKNT